MFTLSHAPFPRGHPLYLLNLPVLSRILCCYCRLSDWQIAMWKFWYFLCSRSDEHQFARSQHLCVWQGHWRGQVRLKASWRPRNSDRIGFKISKIIINIISFVQSPSWRVSVRWQGDSRQLCYGLQRNHLRLWANRYGVFLSWTQRLNNDLWINSLIRLQEAAKPSPCSVQLPKTSQLQHLTRCAEWFLALLSISFLSFRANSKSATSHSAAR